MAERSFQDVTEAEARLVEPIPIPEGLLESEGAPEYNRTVRGLRIPSEARPGPLDTPPRQVVSASRISSLYERCTRTRSASYAARVGRTSSCRSRCGRQRGCIPATSLRSVTCTAKARCAGSAS